LKKVEAVNLFGEPIVLEVSEARRRPTVKRGYAAPPGGGPSGETCKTCKHCHRFGNGGSKHWIKCDLRRSSWTGGEGTDILARSPACAKWEKADGDR
jgi:hypothetical protein